MEDRWHMDFAWAETAKKKHLRFAAPQVPPLCTEVNPRVCCLRGISRARQVVLGQTASRPVGEEEDGRGSDVDWNLRHSWEWGRGEQGRW
jgi:hypothetical protein